MGRITKKIIREHGLSIIDYDKIMEILGRRPNLTELGIFSVMWSEHCSYKSSKKWLKTLPTKAPWVICGPGENAGIIDIGDGQAIVFKMESHNHPSYIEPYQGAATGVGGILRDVFTMGARPIANLNALRFGDPDHPKTRYLVAGVVAGIGGYGNCIGVPTVGGECNFHRGYNGNILVNAMTVGLVDKDRIFYSAAAGIGNPVVYVGSKTGRDGIHGATMASAEFSEEAVENRPTVQVGDPFTEKLLLEACLELMATDAIVAIQDMGAAGLTSSSFEMASKGGVGIEMNLDLVPVREDGMTAYEMMLSESQERMLMVIKPDKEEMARKIFKKWELDFVVIGNITDNGRMVLKKDGKVVADLPIEPLVESSPEYNRSWIITLPASDIPKDIATNNISDTLITLMSCPDIAEKRWIWEQYDYMVMADTVQCPGGDAAVVRIHGTNKGVALTSDCTPRYCLADPVEGGKQAVAEAWRNLIAVGAKPLAITDNMNFGNPERPEIMGQFIGCIRGMTEACTILDFPVVSGNVSLYNETDGVAIPPTPTIGAVGLLADVSRNVTIAFKEQNQTIVLIGKTTGHLGSSLYLREVFGIEDGPPPPVNLFAERRNGDCVRKLIQRNLVTACHDISDGGLAVALTEMALAGNIGCSIDLSSDNICNPWLFGEDQGRYLLTTTEPESVFEVSRATNVLALPIGTTGGDTIKLPTCDAISLQVLREAHEEWLPNYMKGI